MIKSIKASGSFFRDVSRIFSWALNKRGKGNGKIRKWFSKHMKR